ncbi:MAG: hypothetical protein Q7J07_07585 [Pelolinea sp.]|nr:hypothetical protein [Pelolinea sp.]
MAYSIKLLDLEQQPTLTIRAINSVEKLPEFFGIAYGQHYGLFAGIRRDNMRDEVGGILQHG